MKDEERIYLLSLGLLLPENEEEIRIFENTKDNFNYTLTKEALDPNKILDSIKDKSSLTKSQSYFKKSVLAAKIADECCREKRFGSVKFQKLVYLCENYSSFDFHSNYKKQAAGPLDNKFIHSIKKHFESQNWFKVEKTKENGFYKTAFRPLDNLNSYKEYYARYYKDDNEKIEYIISLFKKSLTIDVELVATIFYCCREILSKNEVPTDSNIIALVYSWNKSKLKFSEDDIKNKIEWMKEKSIYPNK